MIDFAIPLIAQELRMDQDQVAATVSLLDDGATVPFIARYRKESTAGLDEVAIISIRDRLSKIRELRVRYSRANHGRTGGHLPTLPPQTAYQSNYCQRERAGTAGGTSLGPAAIRSQAGCRRIYRRKHRHGKWGI